MPLGLDRAPIPAAAVAANPGLAGKTPLEVYDVVVHQLTDAGFSVILTLLPPTSSCTRHSSTTTPVHATAARPVPARRTTRGYRDLSPEELISEPNRQAFFVTGEEHFTAPLWINEFGIGGREETGALPRAWFEHFVDQLIRHRLHHPPRF